MMLSSAGQKRQADVSGNSAKKLQGKPIFSSVKKMVGMLEHLAKTEDSKV